MKTISKQNETTLAPSAFCLGCKKAVPIAALFAVEVTSAEGKVQGYLHKGCRTKWEEEHPGFQYGNPVSRVIVPKQPK